MEPTISRFVLFLGSELLFFIASISAMAVIGLLIINSQALKGRHLLFWGLLSNVIGLLFLVLFVWILTGKSHIALFAVLTVISIALIALVEIASLCLVARNVPWVGQIMWGQREFQELAPTVDKLAKIAAIVVMIVYPVYIGYGYFGAKFRSEDWPQFVIQTTLILLVGVLWVLQLPQSLHVMMSRNLLDDTRTRIFIVQISNSVFMLLMASLYLWTVKRSGPTFALLGDYFVFTPMVAYITVGYLIVLLVIPYLIGHFRSKDWVERLTSERHELIDDTVKGLANPSLPKALQTVDDVAARIQIAMKTLYQDGALHLVQQVRRSQAPQDYAHQLALREIEKRDQRLVHESRLETLANFLAQCKADLAALSTDKDKRDLLDQYSKAIEKEKDANKDDKGATKPLVLVGLTALASSIMSPILASAAKYAAAQLGFGPPPGG